jgi:hypothetical protein
VKCLSSRRSDGFSRMERTSSRASTMSRAGTPPSPGAAPIDLCRSKLYKHSRSPSSTVFASRRRKEIKPGWTWQFHSGVVPFYSSGVVLDIFFE